jgi:NAD-dependent dihydropyrimidine dehydrogenase PreA subunit
VELTVRVMLRFSKEIADRPITSEVILEQGKPVNILSAHMDQQGGEILVEINSDNADRVIKVVEKNDEKCIDCGACVSLCPMDALTFDKDYSIILHEERCNGITCGLCVDACITNAIKLLG